MQKSLNIFLAFIFFIISVFVTVPAMASASGGMGAAWDPGTVTSPPTRLIIPAIGINTNIQGVGVNAKGEMAVPKGSTQAVGWYEYGTIPGNVGSAVIDAHVFAAFSKLKYLQPGADVYVISGSGKTLHFVVKAKQTFALSNMVPQQVFKSTAMPDLNLITCAGSLTADHSTYDHRLVVYTTLVG